MNADLLHHRLGMGFNPQYLSGALTWPKDARYVEAGVSLLSEGTFVDPPWHPDTEVSLHLSRSPICHSLNEQQHFVRNLKSQLPASVKSIGLHLCGPLTQGLGLFGFGSSFESTPKHEESGRRFFKLLLDEIERPILIENANFYDQDLRLSLRALEYTNEIAFELGLHVILDIAHIIMCANNLGISDRYLLGQASSSLVSVIHMSGIQVSPSGALHDGHQLPVYPQAWTLLDEFLQGHTYPITLVLEHTDPRWTDESPAYLADLCEIRKRCNIPSVFSPAHQVDPELVGIGYMANVIIPRRFPQLISRIGRENVSGLVKLWGEDYLPRAKVLAKDHLLLHRQDAVLYDQEFIDPVDDFINFLKIRSV